METLLFKAANNANTSRIEVPEAITSMYHKDIDSRKLEIQLQMLPDLVNAFKKSQNLSKLSHKSKHNCRYAGCSSNGQGYVLRNR